MIGWTSPLSAGSTRSLINEGNEAFEREDFVEAEVQYRKALEQDTELAEGRFNLGGALYKQGKFDGSARFLDKTLEMTTDDHMKANAFFNRGNALFKQHMYRESIESYIQSLKIEPNDLEAKYNLLYALQKLREQEEQKSQEQPPSDDERKEGEEDRQEQKRQPGGDQDEQGSETENQSAEREDQDRREEDMPDQSKPEAADRQISRAEAERILQALTENEMEVQKKFRANPEGRVRVEKDW
jgi:tetratricopeptide (TPR) repeat protein